MRHTAAPEAVRPAHPPLPTPLNLLFPQTLRRLADGTSAVDELRGGAPPPRPGGPAATAARVGAALRRVFGPGHPVTWLLPPWGAPAAKAE